MLRRGKGEVSKVKLLTSFVVLLALSLFVVSCAPRTDGMFNFTFPFFGFPLAIIGLGLYFLPTIIAAIRRSKNLVAIVLLNVFLGWTFIAWVIILVWSLVGEQNRA